MTSPAFALEALGIEKRFGATLVLQGADLKVRRAEIHALLGGNGAGKSTLIRIVSGDIAANAGAIRVGGAEAFDRGAVAVVYQELALLPHLSVAENIRLPRQRRPFEVYRAGRGDDSAAASLALIDPALPAAVLHRPAGSLDLHQRQLVEIARALHSGARLLLLDEPTANLTFGESERLFAILRRLARDEGISTVLVSHRMNEIRAVADVCTIIRDGRTVVDRIPLAEIDDDAIVTAMGQSRAVEAVAPRQSSAPEGSPSRLALRCGKLRVSLAAGDVLGLAGSPDGPMDLIGALVGVAPSRRWDVAFEGRPLRFSSPAEAVRRGVGYVSGDRAEKGILSTLPITDNVVAARRVARRTVLALADEVRRAETALRRLSIKAASVDVLPRTLSGGTQQKLLLARWLDVTPSILVLEEPTRGVDIGTKREIYEIVRRLAEAGTTVVWWSTEFSELAAIASRAVAFDLAGEPSAVLGAEDMTEVALARATGMAA
ncbi:sugar ABC transporter ATP-binding protein [Lichenibacterium minor]|uniref:Sugar ABC transporter ATP-binding protein n=1 Tax=Lichenibacterium minor TaxID=2316528 RepID=A0A4Q2TYJ7_9HYPH|nr:sugar ABC transporter ATP-binding protein [Lichenibacterium minor]RYC29163.1 sugar ABC transporter ATP-binding protein [Lichenibacterium minor]